MESQSVFHAKTQAKFFFYPIGSQAIDLSFGFVIISVAVGEVGHGLDEVLVLVARGETSGQLEDFVLVGVGQFRVEFVVPFEFVALIASRGIQL